MKLLLDTHVFLWYIAADPKLPVRFRQAVQDPTNDVHLSVASVWEAVVKFAIGKLPLPASPAVYLPRQRDAHAIATLPIDEATMPHLAALPPLHRDPFDRVLLAQARQHQLTLVSVDPFVLSYGVPSLAP
jgi:PIN domain nuclease of toxin-antitoxin system